MPMDASLGPEAEGLRSHLVERLETAASRLMSEFQPRRMLPSRKKQVEGDFASLERRVQAFLRDFSFSDVPEVERRLAALVCSAKVRTKAREYHCELDKILRLAFGASEAPGRWEEQFAVAANRHSLACTSREGLPQALPDALQVRVLSLQPLLAGAESPLSSGEVRKWFPFLGASLPSYFLAPSMVELSRHNKIGEGGYGNVYLGKSGAHDVAVKSLKDQTMRHQFFLEASICANLRHAHILLFYGVSFHDEWLIVMELADGGDLQTFLATGDNRARWNLALLIDAALGLQYLHDVRHMIHCDLHVGNIMVVGIRYPKAKISDFGLSQQETSAPLRLAARETYWSAPELVTGAAISRATDIFALGTCVFRALESTGRAPWDSGTSGYNLAKRAVFPVIDGASERASMLFRRMCAFEKEDRPTIAEVLDEMTACRAEDQARQEEEEQLARQLEELRVREIEELRHQHEIQRLQEEEWQRQLQEEEWQRRQQEEELLRRQQEERKRQEQEQQKRMEVERQKEQEQERLRRQEFELERMRRELREREEQLRQRDQAAVKQEAVEPKSKSFLHSLRKTLFPTTDELQAELDASARKMKERNKPFFEQGNRRFNQVKEDMERSARQELAWVEQRMLGRREDSGEDFRLWQSQNRGNVDEREASGFGQPRGQSPVHSPAWTETSHFSTRSEFSPARPFESDVFRSRNTFSSSASTSTESRHQTPGHSSYWSESSRVSTDSGFSPARPSGSDPFGSRSPFRRPESAIEQLRRQNPGVANPAFMSGWVGL